MLLISTFTVGSRLRDRAAYHPARLVCSLITLPRSPFLAPDVLRILRGYNHRGFHPDDNDAADLLALWRDELFGEHGALTNHLK